MTQRSRPQAENVNTNPLYIDSGPYSRNLWAEKLIVEHVGDAVTTRGPYAGYLNALAVSNPAGVTIRVATGAGYVYGSLLVNSANVDFTPDTPAIAARIDKVVLVENNTNAAYDGTASAVILDFPAALADYNALASVPAYSARLAILRGDDATGAATALIQTVNYWMVELARYTISNVPAVSVLTDNRDYVNAETKYEFVPSFYGSEGANPVLPATNVGVFSTILLEDAKTTFAFGRIGVSNDYIGEMYVKGVVDVAGGAGNIYAGLQWYAGGCGEAYNTHSLDSGLAAEAVDAVNQHHSCHRSVAITGVSAGDILYLRFYRNAGDGLDTVNADLPFLGFLIEYLGYRR